MTQGGQRQSSGILERSLYGNARVSAQRAAIARVAARMQGAFTAEDLHREVVAQVPGIGLATIYRAISAMQAAGSAVIIGHRKGATLYAVCVRRDHHHHLVCTECASVVSVECPIDDAALGAAAQGGHLITGHEMVLYGICTRCRKKDGSA